MKAKTDSFLLDSEPRIEKKVERRLGDGAVGTKCTNMTFRQGSMEMPVHCVWRQPGEGSSSRVREAMC